MKCVLLLKSDRRSDASQPCWYRRSNPATPGAQFVSYCFVPEDTLADLGVMYAEPFFCCEFRISTKSAK
jgi:hypothetical protein